MAIEEPEPSSTTASSDYLFDWIGGDGNSFLSSFLDDAYDASGVSEYQLWNQGHNQEIDPLVVASSLTASTVTTTTVTSDLSNIVSPTPSATCKKRKEPNTPNSEAAQHRKQHNQRRRVSETVESDAAVEEGVAVKRTNGGKKSSVKSMGSSSHNNGSNKEGRWAEQLLNPCASAICSGNLGRVQHLLYVLHELASPAGDPNHRLAAYGLRALTDHLSSMQSALPVTFASTETRLFQRSLLKFNENSPWFTFPNTVANAAILQILTREPESSKNLHIVDIGVSHGLQWPTLIEALSRQNGGPPLIRLTIASPQDDHTCAPTFSLGPPEDDFPSRLLRYAKSINVKLQINVLKDHSLQILDHQLLNTSPDENLIVCTQFRLHCLNHTTPDHRNEFLRAVKNLEPRGVILCENDMECSCNQCGDFATGFSRRVEYLWRFLESTSLAFKGRECEERQVMEGEAAAALMNRVEMNEGKESWYEKMGGAGFAGEALGEEAIDGARSLLRKYDSNWEMRVDEKDNCVCLRWKGQPVSFCSLWTLDNNLVVKDS